MIDEGKLDVKKVIDVEVFIVAGLVCCEFDGICFFVKGDLKVKVEIIVVGVFKIVIVVVEKVGGKVNLFVVDDVVV